MLGGQRSRFISPTTSNTCSIRAYAEARDDRSIPVAGGQGWLAEGAARYGVRTLWCGLVCQPPASATRDEHRVRVQRGPAAYDVGLPSVRGDLGRGLRRRDGVASRYSPRQRARRAAGRHPLTPGNPSSPCGVPSRTSAFRRAQTRTRTTARSHQLHRVHRRGRRSVRSSGLGRGVR